MSPGTHGGSRWQPVREALWPVQHLYLLRQMTLRDILGRYKGSVLGVGWSLIYPLMLLATYTFVFRYVFRGRWPGADDHPVAFALNLFAGLVLYTFFSEVVGRAPRLVTEQPNLVKRVVFPLHLLPWVGVASAAFHAGLSLAVLLAALFAFKGTLPVTLVAAVPILLAMLPMLLALAWLLAALGVFLRDLGQVVAPLLTVMLFLSPVLYPLSALPEVVQRAALVNPLALPIESLRLALMAGEWPAMDALFLYALVWGGIATAAAALFERLRTAFADQL